MSKKKNKKKQPAKKKSSSNSNNSQPKKKQPNKKDVAPKAQPKKKAASSPGKLSKAWQIVALPLSVLVCGFLVLGAASLGWYYQFLGDYEHKFYPGVSIGEYDLSGKTYMEALGQLEDSVTTLEQDGISVQYQDASSSEETPPTLQLTPVIVPLDAAGNEREIYSIDYQDSLDAAYEIGRQGNQLLQAKQQFWAWKYGRSIQLTYTFDKEHIQKLISDYFSSYESKATNADISITAAGEIEIVNESLGQEFDYESTTQKVEDHIVRFDTSTITIKLQTDYPDITIDDIREDLDTIENALTYAPITLTWNQKEWTYDTVAVGSWLSFEAGSLAVDPSHLAGSITDITNEVNIQVQEARWEVLKDEGGGLIGLQPFQEAQIGREVDTETTAEAVTELVLGKSDATDSTIELVVTEVNPTFTPENADELGITSILGTGHSNMSGSPYNRRLNIGRGVELLNGLLIAPDEEFSLLDALKPFTVENGYYSELVIKGNETVPEVGGGLCQIGTTTFRAVMGAGLDVTMRQNHSYVVSYYADDRNGQPGTDATIYDPAPDFKFINDTPGYILLQTRIEGNHLYFDFWGTNDGRIAEFTPPTTSGWISPPPTKEIPTADLAPGQRNCTESAHAGTTAQFTYKVENADGTVHEEDFVSIYKPWQAVCLVGIETETSDDATSEDSSTEEASDTTEEKKETNKKKKKKKNSN